MMCVCMRVMRAYLFVLYMIVIDIIIMFTILNMVLFSIYSISIHCRGDVHVLVSY